MAMDGMADTMDIMGSMDMRDKKEAGKINISEGE